MQKTWHKVPVRILPTSHIYDNHAYLTVIPLNQFDFEYNGITSSLIVQSPVGPCSDFQMLSLEVRRNRFIILIQETMGKLSLFSCPTRNV